MAKHDENRDLRSFSRIGAIDYGNKILRASKKAIIGIHMWGKIDYLRNHCGWHFIWDNSATKTDANVSQNENLPSPTQKKVKKESKPTAKTKKLSNKK